MAGNSVDDRGFRGISGVFVVSVLSGETGHGGHRHRPAAVAVSQRPKDFGGANRNETEGQDRNQKTKRKEIKGCPQAAFLLFIYNKNLM